MYRREHNEATQRAEEAVKRNPNYADGYAVWAQVLIYSGEPKEALDKLEKAIKLNPITPFFYLYHLGQANYVWGVLDRLAAPDDPNVGRQRFEEAEKHLREALAKSNNFRPARSYRVAVLRELDRQVDAVKEINISLEKDEPLAKNLKSGNQQLAEEQIRRNSPYKHEEITNRLWNALREAGNALRAAAP
jgi:tetratricopeptide (TPR) repeat protein